MKNQIFVLLFASFMISSNAISVEQVDRMTKGVHKCKGIVNASDEDFDLAVHKKLEDITTRPGKCLIGCVMMVLDIVTEQDGEYLLNEKGWLDFVIEASNKDVHKVKKMLEISAECEKTIDHHDECELAYIAVKCQKNGIAEHGLDVDLGI
ncbi:hypothetical protein PVAND_011042 [Polypedilum vanderplanki]|uniref:Odorant binding protein n=1 Tax=Polypedilum vanderplanki TaxID=319348 RepID=A0A9J6CHE6_POLVA|nr:hypothetical protein PVAND_011042 [Polypedilum vanderplanki]